MGSEMCIRDRYRTNLEPENSDRERVVPEESVEEKSGAISPTLNGEIDFAIT